jgi:PKD repeat protein
MKQIFILFFSFLALFSFSQTSINAYEVEQETYLIAPRMLDDGSIIFTDNYSSTIYQWKSGRVEALHSSAGCGRYMKFHQEKNLIGFKYIDKDGMQAPAVYDLTAKEMHLLHAPANLTGQTNFSDDKIVFTIGNTLYLVSENETEMIDLGAYVNIVEVSPDGRFLSFALNDIIYLMDIQTKEQKAISPQGKMAAYPKFSPEGSKILFQSDACYIYNIKKAVLTHEIPQALSPSWSPDASQILYHKTIVNEDFVLASDMFLYSLKDRKEIQLTHTTDRIEMQAVFADNNRILYHGYNDRSVYLSDINEDKLSKTTLLHRFSAALDIAFYQLPKTRAIVQIPGTIPYVHQVYDTPDWHYGYGSCAPTTCIMAIAYYNLLPKWPEAVSSPSAHISNYGNYVADKYTLNEIYYDYVEPTSGGENAWGGYGFMWDGSYSPNSRQRIYLENHDFTSNQLWTSSCLYANTITEIDNDYPHPICSFLTTSGHLTLATGYVVGQHTLIFHDPYGNRNTPGYPSYDGIDSYYDWPGYNNGYQNLDNSGTNGVVAWTTQARNTHKTYNDTIIDDVDYHHGLEMNNSQNGSHMRNFHDINSGYNNHMWFTYTMASTPDICWVEWIPTLPQSGYYEVSVFIPADSSEATSALYHVHHSGNDSLVILNQSLYSNQWVSLGSFYFDTTMTAKVYLGDSTGLNNQSIAFDAVKWSLMPPPSAAFTVVNNSICVNDSIPFSNTSINANQYLWTFDQASPPTSNLENPTVSWSSPGQYDVRLIAYGLNENDTLEMQQYVVVNPNASASFSALDTVLYLPNAIALFMNNSQDASAYLWDFGDGNTSTDANPWHTYQSTGLYSVRLDALSAQCKSDSIVFTDYIEVLTSINIEDNTTELMLWPNPAGDKISFHIPESEEKISLRCFNIIGELLFAQEYESLHSDETQTLDISFLAEGKYYLLLMSSENRYLLPFTVSRHSAD